MEQDVNNKIELKDNNVTDFVDRLHPVRKIVEQVQNMKNMKDALNVYEQFRILLGVENRAGSAIERGTFNKNLVVNGKSFKDIIEPLFESKVGVPFLPEKVPFSLKAKDLRNRQTYAEFNNYAIAKRVIEKGKQDIETGITALEADLANSA